MMRFPGLISVLAVTLAATLGFYAGFALLTSGPSGERPKPEPRQAAVPGVPADEPRKTLKSAKTKPPKPTGDLAQGSGGDDMVEVVAGKDDGRSKGGALRQRGISILQLGDSHTAADFFTGELRRILQARYGSGGPGYVTAGRPHIGVLSATLKNSSTSGWTYKSLSKSDEPSEFWLSGYSAIAKGGAQSMTFSASEAVAYDDIEIGVIRQPGAGGIEIRFDGTLRAKVDLDSEEVEPKVLRIFPEGDGPGHVRQIVIATTGEGEVRISNVAVYNRTSSGVIYNSIGFPGATVALLNKFDERLFAAELRHIAPQIVILAFGSNEGFKEKLDLERYAQTYKEVLGKIRAALPKAAIVLIGPPDGNDIPESCKDKKANAACKSGEFDEAACVWRTPSNLAAVRETQRQIAQGEGLIFWNWASIMPSTCGAHRWASQSPPLMAKDHLHFTLTGYKASAEEFAKALIPLVDKIRASIHVVSNN